MARVKRNKYLNKKVEYDGHTFDSKKECDRYIFLKRAEQDGLICDLVLQPEFVLLPAIRETFIKHLKTKDKECERVVQTQTKYIADFQYVCNGETIVEDVKASKFMLTPVYKLKARMMRYFHGIVIKEIYKANEPVV